MAKSFQKEVSNDILQAATRGPNHDVSMETFDGQLSNFVGSYFEHSPTKMMTAHDRHEQCS